MNLLEGPVRVVTGVADATTAVAGAVAGAAAGGVAGAAQGLAGGVRRGLSVGSHSTPAAAVTLGAIGAAGLVEWPVLLAVGGSALLVHQLSHRSASANADSTTPGVRAVPDDADDVQPAKKRAGRRASTRA
jgi:hypothetical protein